jgi:integration host factor subunit beta
MTRSGLVEWVAKKGKMSALPAKLVIEEIFDCMKSAFLEGERVEVRGLGTFKVRSCKGYQGRNPKTGEAIITPSACRCSRWGVIWLTAWTSNNCRKPKRRLSRERGTSQSVYFLTR